MNQFISETLKGKTYIDPRTDTGFKSLFANKDAIKDFVDGILQLKGDDQIKNLNYSFEHTLRFMIPEERKVILDAFATTGSKRFLNIEMQKSEEFKTLTKEEKEYRRYEIPETISIWICDFELPHRMGNYIDEWAIYSKEMLNSGTIETIFPKNKYIIVCLPKFNKTADEVKDPVDAWLYVLKHAHEGDPLPDFGNGIVNEALNRIRIENLDKTTLTELEREMIAKEEIECRLAGAKIETRYEMVDAMLANPKFTDEDISSISRISLDEIKKRRIQH